MRGLTLGRIVGGRILGSEGMRRRFGVDCEVCLKIVGRRKGEELMTHRV